LKNRGDTRARKRLFTVALALGIVASVLVAIGMVSTLSMGSAVARPGNTCNPDPGHGLAGCHVEPSTTTTVVSPVLDEDEAASSTSSSTIPIKGPDIPSDPTSPLPYVDKNNCLSCHGDETLTRDLITREQPDGSSMSLYVDPVGLTYSVHRYQDCTTCHGDRPHDVDTPLTKLSLAEKCGSCHQYQFGQYINSVHGTPQLEGNSDPASCTDCHSANSNPHNVVRVLDPAATTYPTNIAETCGKCHNDPELMNRYGIVEKVYDSYMESFHGESIRLSGSAALEQLDSATCVNCHGAHNVASTSDPDSPVAGMENLLNTCKSCHPSAGPEFVSGFIGHKSVSAETLPEVYWGGRAFYIFTRLMLTFGMLTVATSIGLRVVPWTARKIKARGKKEG